MIFIKLNNDNIMEIAKDKGWKGEGIKSNPIVIEKVQEIDVKLILSKIELYVILYGCKFKSISLKNCQNIIINQCQFSLLYLLRSFQNMIKNNEIKHLKLKISGANTFINNQLSKRALKYLKKSIWKREFLSRLTLFFLAVILIFFPMALHSTIFSSSVSIIPLFTMIIISLGLIFLLYHVLAVKWEVRNLPPDQRLKNKEIS